MKGRVKLLSAGAGMILVGLAVLVVMITVLRFSLTPWTAAVVAFDFVVDRIGKASGWNSHLVRGVVTLALIPLAFAVREMVRFRGAGSNRRLFAQVVFAIYIAGFYFAMAEAGSGNRWTVDGEVTKWYSITPDGIREFDAALITGAQPHDPKYGVPLKPVTPDIAASIERARLGIQPNFLKQDDLASLRFFDGATGSALIWFYLRKDGRYDLFDSAGFHPQFNEPLRPITHEVVEDLTRQVAAAAESHQLQLARDATVASANAVEERRLRYLGGQARSNNWLVVSVNGHVDQVLAARARMIWRDSALLTGAFVQDGLSTRLERGDFSVLAESGLDVANQVVVVEANIELGTMVVSGEPLARSEVTLVAHIVRPRSREIIAVDARGIGAGSTASEARANGIERAFVELSKKAS